MRSKIVAGNWKMNNDSKQTKSLVKGIKKGLKKVSLENNVQVIVAPTFVNLTSAIKRAKKSRIEVIAQNMHQESNGAFTGEISSEMLQGIGINTVIIGHSERRSLFGETDEILAKKMNTVIEKDMHAIFCFGEQLEDRQSGNHFSVVQDQLEKGLFHIEANAWQNIVLAYEPVWAIGTGETASPDQAQEMHAFIRNLLKEKYNASIADKTSILYGGSVKPSNAEEIFLKNDVDGGLIGGASLKAKDFVEIIKAI